MKIVKLILALLFIIIFLTSCNTSEKRFKEARSVNTIDAYQNFIIEYPESVYADSSRLKIIELKYQETTEVNSIEAYEIFIDEYPESKFASKAQNELELLLWKKASEENSVEICEKFFTMFPNSSYGNSFKIELSPEWFSVLGDCTGELSEIPENLKAELVYTIKSFSMEGPQRTRKTVKGDYVFMPDPEQGSTAIAGTVVTKAKSLAKEAYITDWAYMYTDGNQSDLIGWALSIARGNFVLHEDILKDGPDDKFSNNHFEVKEYCNGYFLITIIPENEDIIYLEKPQYGLPYFTLNYPGTKIKVGNRLFIREKDGWYFTMMKKQA